MHEKEYKTLYETRNLCKLNTLKRLEKHDKSPGHHTPILNGSSSSSVNSRRLVLKSEISPLIQQRLGYTFQKKQMNANCYWIRKSEIQSSSTYPSNRIDSEFTKRII